MKTIDVSKQKTTRRTLIAAGDITVEREIIAVKPPGPLRDDWPTTDGPKPKCDGND
jgi:hypothetical protein